MEYTVVEEYNLLELITEVNKLIKQGWMPFEGIVVGTNFYQAMTRIIVKITQETSKEKDAAGL
jgi:hypothetical protein